MACERGVQRGKTGCLTCRMRKIKCDEGKPECSRCRLSGRKCDGYTTLPFSRRDLQMASKPGGAFPRSERQVGLIPRLAGDPAFGGILDKRYFQFFCQNTIPNTNSVLRSEFWSRMVLQTCHVEPTIKYCVLALSSLHQLGGLANDKYTAQQHSQYAEEQYKRALREGRKLIASASTYNIDRILITCIIFIIFESVRGNYPAVAVHTDSGRAILAQYLPCLQLSSRKRALGEIESMLARLDLLSMCFADLSSPYRYTLADFHRTNPALEPGDDFSDIGEAQAKLVDLVRWLILVGNCFLFEQMQGDLQSMARYRVEMERCSENIKKWRFRFEEVVQGSAASDTAMILNLRIWFGLAKLYIDAGYYGPETRYDVFMHHFEQIANYGEQLAKSLANPNLPRTMSFDLGYTIPLFVAAARCRDPRLRRRVIAILRNFPRQEGLWESTAAAAIAQRCVELEEEGLDAVSRAVEVPESNRIFFIQTRIDASNKSALIEAMFSGEVRPREVFVHWNEAPSGHA